MSDVRYSCSSDAPAAHGAAGARLSRRLDAALNTAVPFCFFGIVLAWGCSTVCPVAAYLMRFGVTSPLADVLAAAVPWIVVVVVFVADAAAHRTSFGMRRRGLRVVRPDREHPSRLRVAGRCIVGLVLLPLAPLSAWLLFRDPARRSLLDRLTGTCTIDTHCRAAGEDS